MAIARLGNDPRQRLIPPDESPLSEWPTEQILDKDRSFWERIGQDLGLDNLGLEVPDNIENRVIQTLVGESAVIDRRVFGSASPKELPPVAFAFPYQTPRLVRKNLHFLFNYRYIMGSAVKEKPSAIEAPIALALECVAQRKAVETDSTENLILLTGEHPTLELTAATLVREGALLRIEITAHALIDPANVKGSLRHFGAISRRGHFFHAGIGDSARLVVNEWKPGDVIDMGLHAVAIGAVRHGGILNKKRWLGNPINELEIKRTAPVALGVLGTNSAGAWFWRRVVEKGTTLTDRPISAGLNLIDPTGTEKIALVECGNPEFAARRWLCREDWADAGLRWHEVIDSTEATADWDLQPRTSINRQHWNHLACPGWQIVARSDETEQPSPSEQATTA